MLSQACLLLALRELVLSLNEHYSRRPDPHTQERWPHLSPQIWESWLQWYRPRRTGSAPHLKRAVPVAWASSGTTQTQILGLGLAHPNICPVYELLQWTNGLGLPKDNCGISTAQGRLRGVS